MLCLLGKIRDMLQTRRPPHHPARRQTGGRNDGPVCLRQMRGQAQTLEQEARGVPGGPGHRGRLQRRVWFGSPAIQSIHLIFFLNFKIIQRMVEIPGTHGNNREGCACSLMGNGASHGTPRYGGYLSLFITDSSPSLIQLILSEPYNPDTLSTY